MLPFRRILFPVDFSEACRAIVPYVHEARRRHEAELTLVHAFDPAPIIVGEFGSVAGAGFPGYDVLRKGEKDRLDRFAQENFTGTPLHLVLEDGEPGAVITNLVKHEGTDLVMIPTRGYGAVRRFLMGSTAAKVLHDVSCAVWTGVHSVTPDYTPHIPYRSILCAVGSDDETRAVLQAAGTLARDYEARLAVVHSVETPPMAWEVDYAPYRKNLMDAAERELQRLKHELGLEATIHVVEGSPAFGVRELALEHHADLIIAGRGHSQGTLSRIWSHLYAIVRESPCPVLSI